MAQVKIAIGDSSYDVEAAISDQLPVPVLLGQDVPELLEMLQKPKTQNTTVDPDGEMAWMTTTRSQWKEQTKQESEDHQAEANNTVLPASSKNLTNSVTLNCEDTNEEIPGSSFHEELFQGGKIRQKLSKKQKRENNLQRQQMQTKQPLNISTAELRLLQQEDPTLSEIREAAANQTKQSKYFLQDGLLYRRWIPSGEQVSNMSVDQLVLPSHCHKAILSLAHEIPLAGHLGQKITERILQRFYWPTLFQDVREVCKACPECQRTASGKTV